jgi:putative sigma-54 modulation protein
MIIALPIKKQVMDIIIQSLGFKAGAELESYIEDKLGKLSPNEHIVRANVTLFLGPDRATPNDYCEIRLEVPGNDLFIKESSTEFEQAVDSAVNKLQSMLRKAKEKQTDRDHGRVRS